MTLDVTANQLSQIVKAPVWRFSSYDFGREQDAAAYSVVVVLSKARPILDVIRQQIEPGIIAFMGTTHLPQKPNRKKSQEIVIENLEKFMI